MKVLVAACIVYAFVSLCVTFVYAVMDHGLKSVFHGLFWPVGLLLSLPGAARSYWADLKRMAK